MARPLMQIKQFTFPKQKEYFIIIIIVLSTLSFARYEIVNIFTNRI